MQVNKIDLYNANRTDTFKKVLENNPKFKQRITDHLDENVLINMDDFFSQLGKSNFKEFSINEKAEGIVLIDETKILPLYMMLDWMDHDSSFLYPMSELGESGALDCLTHVGDMIKELQNLECSPKRYKHLKKECVSCLNDLFEKVLAFYHSEFNNHPFELICDTYENIIGEILSEEGIVLYYLEGDSTYTLYYDKRVKTVF